MIVVLIGAAIVSGIVGDLKDTVAIIVILVLNGGIGFVQEYRAERAIAALRKMAATSARVAREGTMQTLPATELVPGDVVVLEAGNIVPADLRLTETAQLKINEATLTGESLTIEKTTEALDGADLPLGDRRNMAHKGTIVTNGRARGVAVATGMSTELGRIAQLLEDGGDSKTPLQKRLAHFGSRLAIVVLGICAIVFAAGVLRGEPTLLMLLTAVTLAVAAIPEALPAVVTISLALGARKMVREHALIRRLPAVETLGSVTYICSDKTGTLTQNTMRVAEIMADGQRLVPADCPRVGEPWQTLFLGLAISNDANRNAAGEVAGDPTETALFAAAVAAGYDKNALEADAPRINELAFDSARMRMTTLHRRAEGVVAFTKGSPEAVVAICDRALTANGEAPFGRQQVLDAAEHMASDGLRVLAIAYRNWTGAPSDEHPDVVERELTLLGLVGLEDPPRPEAEQAVRLCRSAGITPVLITGDHPATAHAIAKRLGILADDARVVTGPELTQLSDEALESGGQGDPRLRARRPGAEDPHRPRTPATGRIRGHDRRRRERRAGAQACRHRHRNGPRRHGRGAGGVEPRPARRQLRDDRLRGAGRAQDLRQYSEVHPVHDDEQHRRDPDDLPRAFPRTTDPAAPHSHPLDQPRHGRAARPRAFRRASGEGHHEASAKAAVGKCLCAGHVAANHLGRLAHGRGHRSSPRLGRLEQSRPSGRRWPSPS